MRSSSKRDMSANEKLVMILGLLVVLLPACGRAESTTSAVMTTETPAPPVAYTMSYVSPTPRPTQTVTRTPAPSPTPTLTPTPTPTPTPTALPLIVSGDPRAGLLSLPVPQGNAACGVVDLLDFPLDPPDGDNVTGGRDFGVFRDRYGKYHAGEDWWGPNRRASFGQPVYSIGHGLVTYAEPEGWNRDKGVIIIQHTFADGSSVLSFYGHLDPPSVLLKPGQCVARGEQIGQIGRPRGSPHLHFEIRSQSPNAPLTGYWPDDPTLVGWLPPSAFIWNQRLTSTPGVQWTRPFIAAGSQPIGMGGADTFILLEGGKLIGISLLDGSVRWQYSGQELIRSALLDARELILYLANDSGQLQAVRLSDTDLDTVAPGFALLWQRELSTIGTPLLLPLPAGGVAVSLGRQLLAISPDGRVQWMRSSIGQPIAWVTADGQLFFSTTGQGDTLWQMNGSDLQPWNGPVGSKLVVTAEQVWLYAGDGLYHLNPETKTAILHYPLPAGSPSLGDVAALPDGGILLAHTDPIDRRLIAFGADGSLRWERSYAGLVAGKVRLLITAGTTYLVAEDNSGSASQISLFSVDLTGAGVKLLFTGGTRSPVPADTWLWAADERLLLNIGGGHLLSLDIGSQLN